MTHIPYEGIRVDQGWSPPTALIRIPKIENCMLSTQNGYQNTRQTKLVQKNTIIYHFQQPVFRKPVISVNFHLQLNWNSDVILNICLSGISNFFYDIIYYHHTKFHIDVICLKKVTGGSFAGYNELGLLLYVCEYLGLN